MNFPHPLLEGLLKETYGIFVYQQVMQAAQVLAGYPAWVKADLLRRAMGKKIKSEMDAQARRLRRRLQASVAGSTAPRPTSCST